MMSSDSRRQLAIAWILLLVGPASLLAQPAQTDPPFRLLPGDAIRVEVKNEPNLSGQFQVTIEGVVMLPLLGLVHVADRPLERVLADLREQYGRELADPEVLLTPLVRVVVAGEVRAPGLFMADPTLTLADVLAMAGGPLPTANKKRLTMVRDGADRRMSMVPGSMDLMERPRSGDRLFVARRSWVTENLPILVGAAASVAAAAVTSVIVR
jgi:polysaccharide export outer membrane protein